jgi:hypothetical protein
MNKKINRDQEDNQRPSIKQSSPAKKRNRAVFQKKKQQTPAEFRKVMIRSMVTRSHFTRRLARASSQQRPSESSRQLLFVIFTERVADFEAKSSMSCKVTEIRVI